MQWRETGEAEMLSSLGANYEKKWILRQNGILLKS